MKYGGRTAYPASECLEKVKEGFLEEEELVPGVRDPRKSSTHTGGERHHDPTTSALPALVTFGSLSHQAEPVPTVFRTFRSVGLLGTAEGCTSLCKTEAIGHMAVHRLQPHAANQNTGAWWAGAGLHEGYGQGQQRE